MGSFAVGCGVSNLPIKNYDPVVFVFLVKNSNKENRTFLLHNDDLYKPFLLPIKGTYNDYGTLENIEKDINVELIEKHYKVNIETLLELVSESGGNVLSKYSPYLKAYDIKKLNLENTSESLLKNGFNLENNDSYEYFYNKEYDIKIENINKNDKFNFDVKYYDITCNGISKQLFISSDFEEGLNFFLYHNFNIILGLENKNDIMLIKEIEQLNGMFVRKEIYDNLTQVYYNDYPCGVFKREDAIKITNVSKLHLTTLGFVEDKEESEEIDFKSMSEEDFMDHIYNMKDKDCLFRKDNIVIEYGDYGSKFIEPKKSGFYNVNDLVKILNKMDYNIDISSLSHLTDSVIDSFKVIEEIKNSYQNKLNRSFMSTLNSVLNDSNSPLFSYRSIKNSKVYTNYLKEQIIEQLNNKQEITFNKELLDSLDDFKYFINSMTAANVLFKPSFCAYQEGSLEMNKYLNKVISSEIKNINKSKDEIYNDLYK